MLQFVHLACRAQPTAAFIRSSWQPPRHIQVTKWSHQVLTKSYATSKTPSSRQVRSDVQPAHPNLPLAYRKTEAPSIAPKPVLRTVAASPPRHLSQSFTGIKGTPSETLLVGKGYPARLLIYNAGSVRTVFIASIRLVGVLIFIFAAFLISPAYYYSPLEPTWKAFAALGLGVIPVVVMSLTTPPFVTYIHLALPQWARRSHSRLMLYAQNLPGSATLDMTSIRWLWPRVTTLRASELYIHKNSIGGMTLRREIPKNVWKEKKWYDWRPLKKFAVLGQGGKTVESGVWDGVVSSIRSQLPRKDKVRKNI